MRPLLLLLPLLLAACAGGQADNDRRIYDAAFADLRAGRYPLAAARFEELALARPNSDLGAAASMNRCMALSQLRPAERGIAACSEAMAHGKAAPQTEYARAIQAAAHWQITYLYIHAERPLEALTTAYASRDAFGNDGNASLRALSANAELLGASILLQRDDVAGALAWMDRIEAHDWVAYGNLYVRDAHDKLLVGLPQLRLLALRQKADLHGAVAAVERYRARLLREGGVLHRDVATMLLLPMMSAKLYLRDGAGARAASDLFMAELEQNHIDGSPASKNSTVRPFALSSLRIANDWLPHIVYDFLPAATRGRLEAGNLGRAYFEGALSAMQDGRSQIGAERFERIAEALRGENGREFAALAERLQRIKLAFLPREAPQPTAFLLPNG